MYDVYLEDGYCFHNEARIVGIREGRIAPDWTCFYPGGGPALIACAWRTVVRPARPRYDKAC